MHGGSTGVARKAAARRVEQAKIEKAAETYGLPRKVAPHEALLEELYRTAGHVAWLGNRVRQLREYELHGPVGGETYPREEPSVWIRMYHAERKHMSDVAATCLRVGIEERAVRVAEEQGRLMARAIYGILKELGVHDREEVPAVVRRHLSMVRDDAESSSPA